MSNKEKENKALPFEVKRGFTALPNSVSDYYTMHPRFTGATERLYLFLLRMHNEKKGYAYPGYKSIREHTKIGSDDTISKAIDSLKHLRLISVETIRLDNGHKSNRYYFNSPIEDYDEFIRVFGDELPEKYRKKKPEFSEEVSGESDELGEIIDWL